ncbi:hypothetical protein [uncultured Bacteroides sp.]|uniref:hypothetical protein n=1 Tax=uncultured Bacteroides sp. TaxID=162156 RepID=UPI0025EBD0F0|nr:hypothetical protein [uncultured Bacteroides sp.]
MKKQIVLIIILFFTAFAQAQEVFVNADFVSSYIWRGIDSGNASVQPSLSLQWKGLTAYVWGSTEFRNQNNEIDLSLEYEYKNLTLYANNCFIQTEDEPFKYFNYNPHTTGHTFEIGAGYRLSEKFPLSVNWYTTFGGNDYRENGKRAWSSYCELSYPFSVKEVELSIEAGFTPWESFYSDKFNVVNIGLSATKEIKITSGFSLPVFGKLIANPYTEQAYFVFGITL